MAKGVGKIFDVKGHTGSVTSWDMLEKRLSKSLSAV